MYTKKRNSLVQMVSFVEAVFCIKRIYTGFVTAYEKA